jgi:hypothetical protein
MLQNLTRNTAGKGQVSNADLNADLKSVRTAAHRLNAMTMGVL